MGLGITWCNCRVLGRGVTPVLTWLQTQGERERRGGWQVGTGDTQKTGRMETHVSVSSKRFVSSQRQAVNPPPPKLLLLENVFRATCSLFLEGSSATVKNQQSNLLIWLKGPILYQFPHLYFSVEPVQQLRSVKVALCTATQTIGETAREQ